MTLHNLRPGQHPYNDASSPQADTVHPERTIHAFGKPPLDYALYSTPEECDRSAIYRDDAERVRQIVRMLRREQWQFRVKISCIALAGLIVCGIIAQFSRGWF